MNPNIKDVEITISILKAIVLNKYVNKTIAFFIFKNSFHKKD